MAHGASIRNVTAPSPEVGSGESRLLMVSFNLRDRVPSGYSRSSRDFCGTYQKIIRAIQRAAQEG